MVSPNPVRNQLKIELKDFNGATKIELINALGQIVVVKNNTGKSINLDVSNFARGVYNVIVSSDENIFSRKIILE